MVALNYDVKWNDHGADAGTAKLSKSLTDLSHKTKQVEDSQLKLAQAEVKGKGAALQLEAAQAKLAKVEASGKGTAEQKARAELAVEQAQLKVTKSTRDAQRAQEELAVATTATGSKSALSGIALAGLGVAAGGGALAFAKIVTSAADFDKQLSNVQAVSGATAGELENLRGAAIQAGADTAFSASEAATAEGELAKAGVSTSDILGGALTGSLSLAAAGQLGLGDAASIAAQAMTIFKLSGTDVTHIADVLAAGANKSTADVSGLGVSLTYAGSTAAAMGLSLEDTVGTLALFSNNAINGSEAGTGLRGVLASLAKPSSEAATKMDQVGLSAFDAQGDFVGLANFAQQLKDKLGPLTQAQREQTLVTIFGREQLGAATALYNEGGDGVRKYTDAVNQNGAAADVAGTNLNNLAGDLDALGGSIETALIKTGENANGVLRFMAEAATNVVNGFADLPGPVQAAALGFLALGTAGTGLLTAIGTIAPKIREARESLASMGKIGSVANTAIGYLGKTFAVAAPVIGIAAGLWEVYTKRQQEAAQRVNDLTRAIESDSGALGKNTAQAVANALEQKGALEAGKVLGLNLKTLTDAALGNRTALADVYVAQLKYNSGAVLGGHVTEEQAKAAVVLSTVLGNQEGDVKKAVDSSKRLSEATGEGTKEQKDLGAGVRDTASAFEEEASTADQVKTAIDKLNGTSIDAATTQISYLNAVQSATAAIKDNGGTIDVNTQKGRDNRSAVIAAIKAAEDHASAVATQTGSVERGNAVFADHITKLRETLNGTKLTKAEVDELIKAYGKTPTNVHTKAELDAAAAKTALTDYKTRLDGLQRKINGIHGKQVQIDVSAFGIETVRRDISAITGKTVGITVGKIGEGPQARAIGGPVSAGHPYLVGEHGPELLVPGQSGTIIPNRSGSRSFAGGRSYNISVTVAPGGHPADVGSQLVKLIRTYEERSGAGWRG